MAKCKKAFTLIELLVVISIIALLVAILMPALNRAREQAKVLLCEMNMKGLMQAFIMYAGDNEDTMCSGNTIGSYGVSPQEFEIAVQNGPWVWEPTEPGASMPIDHGGDQRTYVYTLRQRQEGIQRGALFPYAENHKIYNCSSDKSYYGHYRTYSIPDGINTGEGAQNYFTNCWWKNVKKMGGIKNPTEKYIFLEENDWKTLNFGSFWLQADIRGFGDGPAVWHFGSTSFGFADGHCELYAWDAEVIEQFDFLGRYYGWVWGYVPQTPEGKKDYQWMEDHWPTRI
ncbi:MAG: type II secretion system protein [Sedimentisphaerales bacterium]|nr:type II secretion system protein [Sedimentisphaerales bacterium]